MISTIHNHTDWSDGETDFAEMIDWAAANKVDELGFADHFCIFPDGTTRWWSVDPERLDEYMDQIASFRSSEDISILQGLEVDWFNNHQDVLEPILDRLDLDYRYGSLHHVDEEPFDNCFAPEKGEEALLEVWRKYWELETSLAASGLFDVVAHIDIPKRLGYFPEDLLDKEINVALDTIAAHGVTVELNTAGFGLAIEEAYASSNILRKCVEREISITLTADGHCPSRILFEFERGLKVLHAVGVKEIARFSKREIRFECLDTALKSGRNP